VDRHAWRTYRVDRLRPVLPTGPRFAPRDPPADVAAYVSNSLDTPAVYVGLKGVDFEVLDPPELVEHLRMLGSRLTRASRLSRRAVRGAGGGGR
jgi:hypothetical protein